MSVSTLEDHVTRLILFFFSLEKISPSLEAPRLSFFFYSLMIADDVTLTVVA